MKFSTDGLVIRTVNVGESDRAVTVLTRDRGLMSAFATGARKQNSKNGAATSLLTYSDFTVSKTKDTCRITDSETREVFFGLRGDIMKYALAQYICELCLVLVPYDVEDSETLRLVLNSLYYLSSGKLGVFSVKAVTELRLMSVAGFMPELSCCRRCGKESADKFYLDTVGGEIVCKDCCREGAGLIELDRTTLAAARHIIYSPLDRLYSFSLPENAAKYLSRVTEQYLLSQTAHRFKTLDFFHGISSPL